MGRTAKVQQPDVPREAVKEVTRFAASYRERKLRIEYFPLRRPSFMRRLEVSVEGYAESGLIGYDREHTALLHEDDQAFIHQYEEDMRIVYFLEAGVASLRKGRIRNIGQWLLLEGWKVADISQEVGLCISYTYAECYKAKCFVAEFIDKNRKEYGHE